MRNRVFFALVSFLLTSQGFAQTGADALLDSLSGGAEAKSPGKEKEPDSKTVLVPARHLRKVQVNFNDSFQRQLYAQMETSENLSFDLREWANFIFEGDYAQAAHLWTALQSQIPETFRTTADSAYLYILYKINLPQTFFQHWITFLADKSYRQSPSELALEGIVTVDLDKWLIVNAPVVSIEQETIITSLDQKKDFVSTLKAWTLMRKQEKAEAILSSLPAENKLKPYLAQTVALAHVRRNDLVGAARILKRYLEPTIEANHDVNALAQHYMNIARILYQAGQMKGAQEFYEKIPNTSPQFLEAREELAWVLLRKGDTSRLRGELETLKSPLFRDLFAPEVFLVRAISNLKMCYYDAVEKDFENFNAINGIAAKKIDAVLNSQDPPVPSEVDTFTRLGMVSVSNLRAELARLKQLGDQSIAATLPAVGVQKHWKENQVVVTAALEIAKKHQADEFRREWKNQRNLLTEAIKKMRFVKVEYLSQVRQLAKNGVEKSTLVAANGTVTPASAIHKEAGQMSFPYDGEIWPDELFKLRSAAQTQCLKTIKSN